MDLNSVRHDNFLGVRNIEKTGVDDLPVQDIFNTSSCIICQRLLVELMECVGRHVFHHASST